MARLRDKPVEDGLEKMLAAIKSSLLRHPVKLESHYFLNQCQKHLADMLCVFAYALNLTNWSVEEIYLLNIG